MNKKIIGSANGMVGCLIWCGNHKFMFRITDKNGNFNDLEILHCDMTIQIQDEDAFLYRNENGDMWLDHSPGTLGINDEK